MLATIKGIRKIDYVKKDGTEVDAVNIYVEHRDIEVTGMCTAELYFSTKQLNNLGVALPEKAFEETIGKECNIEYNSRGFVMAFDIEQ